MSNEPDKVNSGALATMIVVVALATFAIAAVVTSLVRDETARLRAEGDLTQERAYRQLRAEQETKLNASAGWVDKEAGLAKIPVKSAQLLVLEAVRANPLALSPGNPPEEEEDEVEEGEEASEDEATEEASEDEASEEAIEEEKSSEADDKAKPAEKKPAEKKPAEKKPAPAPKVVPAPAPKVAPAPAPVAPAPVAPAPVAPAPAPGGPAQ